MAVYLKQFENHTQYENYINGSDVILPNVSICTTEGDVHYNPIDPYNGHDYVEIGGLKWATMNIGANSITDTGLYFQWGDTQGYTASQVGSGEGQKYFGWEDYKYSDAGGTTMTKYNSTDGLITLEEGDDAVTAAWGGQWRMPTTDEYAALGNAVNTALTADYQGSGVAGMICTDKTDSSKVLFFPAAGISYNGSVDYAETHGRYWSNTLAPYGRPFPKMDVSYNLYFNSDGEIGWQGSSYRSYGYPIRGVAD